MANRRRLTVMLTSLLLIYHIAKTRWGKEAEVKKKAFPRNLRIKDPENCKPETKVVFSKTHKTGSTTVQDILFRYGVRNNLNFAFPPNLMHIHPVRYPMNMMQLVRSKKTYDIFAFHGMWKLEEISKVIPRGVRFTILRDPVTCFESIYYYYYREYNSYRRSLNQYALEVAARNASRSYGDKHGKNNQLFDLGLETKYLDNPRKVSQKIASLDKEFDLVMITEYFEESLILLKRELCWTFDDIAYISKNRAFQKSRRKAMTGETQDLLRRWLWAEYELYDFFKWKLLKKIEAYGRRRMEEDKAKLREANHILKDKCSYREKLECKLLDTPEIQSVKMLRTWQESR